MQGSGMNSGKAGHHCYANAAEAQDAQSEVGREKTGVRLGIRTPVACSGEDLEAV